MPDIESLRSSYGDLLTITCSLRSDQIDPMAEVQSVRSGHKGQIMEIESHDQDLITEIRSLRSDH